LKFNTFNSASQPNSEQATPRGTPMNGHALEEAFIDADAKDYQDMATDFYETYERGHGRVETRRY
jgi:hypothetical protein